MRSSDWPQRLVHYQFIEELLEGRRVLELGCGRGQGALFLSRRARDVLAVDTSAADLDHCRALPGQPNLQFQQADPGHLRARDGSFDAVLVPELKRWTTREGLLSEILRVLRPQGLALFAVSSGDLPGAGGMTFVELQQYLGGGFPHVRVYGQIPFSGYTLADFQPGGDSSPLLDCSLVAEDDPPSSYLALGCRAPLESLGYAVLQVPGAQLTPTGEGAAEVERALARQGSRIEALEQRLQQERDRVDRERDRAELAGREHLQQQGRADAEAVRAEAAERSLDECRRSLSQLSRRAETAERRNDSLLARVEQGSAELSRLHQRIAEMQGLRQAEQWRVDELNGRLRECEEQLLAARGGEVPAAAAAPAVAGDGAQLMQQARHQEQELRQEITRVQEQEEAMVGRLQQRLAGAKERARVAEAEAGEARGQTEQLQELVEQLEARAGEWGQERAHLEKELMKSESRVVEHTRRATNAESQIAQMEVRLKRTTSEASTLSKWAGELRDELKDAQGVPRVGPMTPEPEVAALRNDLRLAEQRNGELELRCDRFIQEAEQAQAALREKEEILAAAMDQQVQAGDGDGSAQQVLLRRLEDRDKQLNGLRQELAGMRAELQEARSDLEVARADLDEAYAHLREPAEPSEGREQEGEDFEDELDQGWELDEQDDDWDEQERSIVRERQLDALLDGAAIHRREMAARMAQLLELQERLEELRGEAEDLEQALADCVRRREDQDGTLSRLRAENTSLGRQLAQVQGEQKRVSS